MKRTTALLFAALALTACDSESEDLEPRVASVELDEADEADDARGPRELGRRGERGHHGKRGGHDPSAPLCEAVSCTEAQLEQVKAVFASPERGERGDRPERPDMSAANAALAKAFASEGFSGADLDAWTAQTPTRPEHGDRHLETMSELHTILSADQRKTLATKITAGEMFGGKSRGKHERRGGDMAAEEGKPDHHARMVEGFCESIACTDAQKADLTAVFAQKRADRPDHEAKRAALAAAFEADSFDADAVADLLERRPGDMDATLVSIHEVLTAEQRATLAERIAEQGPRALLGRGGKHHGKRGGERGGEREQADEGREFG